MVAVPLTPKFPLPRNYFEQQGPALTPAQQTRYCAIAHERIAAALSAERDFVVLQQRQVSPTHWKLTKRKHDMRIYRRRGRIDGAQPDMLGVGRMDGTLEDLIYGTYDKSSDEMQTTMSFVDVFTKDCAVLHNLELATPTDPFHYVGLKWALTQLPGKLFVKPRDWCYIEAMGIERDAQGRRFGYTIVHSVDDVPNCRAFDSKAVVRGKGSLSFIYREVLDAGAAPGTLEVFAQGLFDPAGDLLQYFSVIMTTAIFSGQAKTVQCAEAKKLTLLAQRNFQERQVGREQQAVDVTTCGLCVKRDSVFTSLKVCNVCGATVCDKCRTKRVVFLGAGAGESLCDVVCCTRCIIAAQHLQVRPAEAAFTFHSNSSNTRDDRLLSTASASIESSASSKSPASWTDSNGVPHKRSVAMPTNARSHVLPLTTKSADDFVDTASEDDYSSMGESDFERMIEAMIDERLALGTAACGTTSSSHHNATAATGGSSSRRTGSQSVALDLAPSMPLVLTPTSGRSMSVAASTALAPAAVGPQAMTHHATAEQEQAALFEQMLALQRAASRVLKITQDNEAIMHQMSS